MDFVKDVVSETSNKYQRQSMHRSAFGSAVNAPPVVQTFSLHDLGLLSSFVLNLELLLQGKYPPIGLLSGLFTISIQKLKGEPTYHSDSCIARACGTCLAQQHVAGNLFEKEP